MKKDVNPVLAMAMVWLVPRLEDSSLPTFRQILLVRVIRNSLISVIIIIDFIGWL